MKQPILTPHDLSLHHQNRESIQTSSQGNPHPRRTRTGAPDGGDGSDDSGDSDDDDPDHKNKRGDDKGKDRDDKGRRSERKKKQSEDDDNEDDDNPSLITGKGFGRRSNRHRSVKDEQEDMTTYEAYYGTSHSIMEEEFIIDSLETRPKEYKTKDGQHLIVVPFIYSVPGLCRAKLTGVLKDFVGKVEAKKICDAGSLIVRLRDIIVYMTNMGISLKCLAEIFGTFAITDEEKNMIGPNKNSLKQLLIWI